MRSISIFILSFFIACSGPQTKQDGGTSAGSGFIDCEKQNLAQLAGPSGLSVLGEVAGAISGGKDGWQNVLTDLEVKLGPATIACAVDAVKAVFLSGPRSSAAGPNPTIERADEFLRAKNYKFKTSLSK